MKNTFIIFSLSMAFSSIAQEVVSSQGDSYSNSNGSIDFTVGEVIISTESDGSNDLTQGFHQSNWKFVSLEDHDSEYVVSVFPNPAENILTIETKVFDHVDYALYDAKGKLILTGYLENDMTSINVDHFAPGSYSLILKRDDKALKTFKLIKLSK